MSGRSLPQISDVYQERQADWRCEALCAGMTELFFAERWEDTRADVAAAKEVCAGCPSRAPCLSYALSTNQEYGIYGGLTPKERRKLRRRWVLERAS